MLDHLDIQPGDFFPSCPACQKFTGPQGVIASGLAALSVANGDRFLLDQAEITLDAAVNRLTVNGILKESCDDVASGGVQCNHDQQSFKVRRSCFPCF